MTISLTKIDQNLWSSRAENKLDAALYEKGFVALLNGEHEVKFVPVDNTKVPVDHRVPALKVDRASKGFMPWKNIAYGAEFSLTIQ